MGLSGCMSCLKYLLFAFNFIFWLAGVGILALAIFFRVDGATSKVLQSDTEQRDLFYAVCYVLMAVGGAIMIVGFCGCCGALQESRMLLTLFAVALFLLLGTEIGAGVYTNSNKAKVTKTVDEKALELWKGSAAGTNNTALLVDEIEKELNCCGYNGVWDYCDLAAIDFDTIFGSVSIKTGDLTCKKDGSTKKVSQICPTLDSAMVGCRERMLQVVEKNLNIVIGVAVAIGVVQLLGFIFSILLCQAIGRDYTSGKLA